MCSSDLLALGVQEKAIANKLTTGFEGLPEYDTITWADQAKQAVDLLNKDPQRAIRIAMGEELPPGNLKSTSVFVAVEDYATAIQDGRLLHDLATVSSISKKASIAGQEIAMLATRNQDSAVASIQDVQAARESAATRRYGTKMKQQVQNEIVKARY